MGETVLMAFVEFLLEIKFLEGSSVEVLSSNFTVDSSVVLFNVIIGVVSVVVLATTFAGCSETN